MTSDRSGPTTEAAGETSIVAEVLARIGSQLENKGYSTEAVREVVTTTVEEVTGVISVVDSTHFIGDPEFLSVLIQSTSPGAELVLEAVVDDYRQRKVQSDHRMDIERRESDRHDQALKIEREAQATENRARLGGLNYALIIALGFIVAAVGLALAGHDTVAGGCIGAAALGVVARFIDPHRRHESSRE